MIRRREAEEQDATGKCPGGVSAGYSKDRDPQRIRQGQMLLAYAMK